MKRFLLPCLLASALLCGSPAVAVPPPASSPNSGAWTVESAASTNATVAKSSIGALYGFSLCNNTASVKFFKFYDKASAPTVGTDVVFMKVQIPANQCRDRVFVRGVAFLSGIAFAITGAEPNSDATAVAAGDVNGTFDYK